MALGPKSADVQLKVNDAAAAITACIARINADIAAMQTNDGSNDQQTVLMNAAVAAMQPFEQQLTAMANGMTVVGDLSNS